MSTAVSSVNPYELLGVKEDSPLSEVRRAYFRIALVCHPDKGGSADDMRVVQSAYDWIVHHINTVKAHGTETYEEKEDNFKEFLESQQKEKVLTWDEVCKDVLDLTDVKFDEMYDRLKVTHDDFAKRVVTQLFYSRMRWATETSADPNAENVMLWCIQEVSHKSQSGGWFNASHTGGYGEYFQNTPTDIDVPIERPFGKQELIVYEEPIAIPPSLGTSVAPPEDKLEDYTTDTLCDYRVAYMDAQMPLQTLEESLRPVFEADVNKRMEDLAHERNMLQVEKKLVFLDLHDV